MSNRRANRTIAPGHALAWLSALTALPSAAAAATPAAPEGPPIELAVAPRAAGPQACSLRHRACVRAVTGTRPELVMEAVGALDRAWDTLTGPVGLPAPDPGADGIWTATLVDGVADGGWAELSERDPVAPFDRGASFGLIDRATPPGCALDAALARAIARGSLWRAAPATDPGSARAEARMMARLAVPCAAPGDDGRAFQAEPERAVLDPSPGAFGAGASRFFEWLDRSFSDGQGALIAGMWALAPTRTPARAARWAATPTGFDVLRVSLAGALGTDSNLDDLMLEFAIDRALAPPPVRLAWHVPWPERARRFASPVAVAPTGASYVMVDHAGAPAGASLRVMASWEDYGRMRWAVVKLDAAGRALAVLPITSPPRATSAALTVELIDAVDRLLIVGAGVGSTEHKFDPDQGWWEPHGWLLTVEGG